MKSAPVRQNSTRRTNHTLFGRKMKPQKKPQKALKEAFGLTDDESQKVSSALDELFKNPESFIAKLDEELARRRNQKL